MTLRTAVFAHQESIAVIDLDIAPENAAATLASMGFSYCGSIAVIDGTPKTEIEPGCEALMLYAGITFAGLLGERLKQEQLAASSAGH